MTKTRNTEWLGNLYRRNHILIPPEFKSGLCVACKGTGSVPGMGLKDGKFARVPRQCHSCLAHRTKEAFIYTIRTEAAARSQELEPIKKCISDIFPLLPAFCGPVVGAYMLSSDAGDLDSDDRIRAFCVFRHDCYSGKVEERASELGFDTENGIYFWHERRKPDSFAVERQAVCQWWHSVTKDKWPSRLFA